MPEDSKLLTTKEVAVLLGISPRRVRELAKSRKLGQQISQQITREEWRFTESDIEAMRDRRPGKPSGAG